MEQDIKNLQEIINLCNEELDNKNENVTAVLDLTDLLSLRNIIKAYKELEEKVMQKDLEIIGVEEYTKAGMAEIIEHYYTANEDCIPESKIKEKIEELKQEGNYKTLENPNGRVHFQSEPCDFKIQVLQELLEKRK